MRSRVVADDFGTGDVNTGFKADSADHYFCVSGLVASSVAFGRAAMSYLDSHTDMITHEQSCTAATDAIMQSVNLPGSVRGQYHCVVLKPGNICDSSTVSIDEAQIAADGGDFDQNLAKTTLHETGHSAGLRHYTDSTPGVQSGDDCMVSGVVDNNQAWVTYSPHRTAHINNAY